MQDLKPETVGAIIRMARELNAGAETVTPDEENEAYEHGRIEVEEELLERERHEEFEHDPTYQELRRYINELSLDEQCELVALAWLGRGDGTRDEWDELAELARERHTSHTPEYLLSMPPLGEYLADGLEAFGFSAEDYEGD